MDFVVIGLGLSALALLTGLTLLCLVAPRWFRKAGVAQPGDAAYARAQAGVRHALGQGFLCVGAVLLLSTLGGISAGLADKAGAYLIATMTTLTVIGLLGWDLLYRRQHPIPARRRTAPVRTTRATADERAVQPAASSATSPTTTTVRRRVLPARQRVLPTEQPIAAAAAPLEFLAEDAQRDIEAADGLPQTDSAEDAASDAATPESRPLEPDSETRLSGAASADPPLPEEPEQPDAGEANEVAAILPELVPLQSAHANGASDPAASIPPIDEPEVPTYSDDRVIALFPTAAARRSRTIVAPTDPDDQS